MGQQPRGWFRGCTCGCGLLLLLSFMALLTIGVRTCVPLRHAERSRAELDERFGPPESFTPAADGSIPADRLQRFLEIRGRLADQCVKFTTMQTKMQRVDGIGDEEPSGKTVVDATKGLASVGIGIAPAVGEFFEHRNQALLDAGMGLGEYCYIFAIAYRRQLAGPPEYELFFDGDLSPDVLSTLRAALSNQLRLVQTDDGTRDALERELRALHDGPPRLPWSEQLPRPIEQSLAPLRQQLDEGYCSATAGIEMDPDSRRAMAIAFI